ncbi:hypothetical protein PNEG_00972 [Pneumocystis murina B123]|uniref:Uncharacterized protein n=1 Tax=Pneumocystis murina (strain B123) TaxID=1069680 RepID=M7NUQ5_PNEMU|nr:hypothetical protein PNEG_00972 [Pneumocystis murina B123]EMR10826.1 hypothetical protein PNEG_00972 [Pneumocystis murina B123]
MMLHQDDLIEDIPLRICHILSILPACYWAIHFVFGKTQVKRILYVHIEYAWEIWMASIWFIVCAFLFYKLTSGLLLRWHMKYSYPAILIRLMSLNLMNGCLTRLFVSFSSNKIQQLFCAILMTCILACIYIIQNYVTSNFSQLGITKAPKRLNLINIAIYVMVPIGFASFITMLCALFHIKYS